ncbi:GGDEF domain-containing protein [Vogesella oryzae]|uniref:GGDEF domain-containing protein n=1 Tax=Vogesella oryzae TaxID=1735285 RepID=UPI0015844588|nr:GGDEF domain-containing protein [Vogesella oryzae]
MSSSEASISIAHLVQQLAKMSAQREQNELEHSLLELISVLLPDHRIRFYSLRGNDQELQVHLLHRLDKVDGYRKASTGWQPPDELMRQAILRSDDDPTPWHLDGQTWQVIRQRNRRMALLLLEGQPLDEQEQGFLAAIVLIHENYLRLLYDAERDMLTGLLNRRTFDNRLYELLSMPDSGYSLALMDIDHFKQINDRYGHIVGDEVLLRISQLMTSTLGQKARLYRYGGEEFAAIISPRTSDVGELLELLKQTIAETVFPQVGQVTLSIGHVRIERQPLPANVVEQADKALYFAKEHGRNLVADYASLQQQGLAKPDSWPQGDIELF